MNFQGGTLSGVTYDGTLSSNSPYIYIATGLTADDLAGTGPGTINLTGTIYFEGNQTFNNATINLGGTIYNDDSNDTGSVLTLGPNVVVDQGETSGYASLGSAGGNNTGDGIVNEGTINAQAVNGSFYIEPYNFTNQGTINVSNGDTLYIEPSVDLTNAGTITLAAGTTLTLGSGNTSALSNTGVISGTDDTVNIYSFGSFSNTGTFNITSSTVNLYGSYTTAQLALFDNKADTITIDGTLTNTGEILTVGAGSALGTVILASDGSIVGGTVVDQGSGVNFQGGTLSGVTYDGTLSSNSPYIYIATGLTADDLAGTGPGTINLTGTIYFEGNQTFNNATINLGGTIYNDDSNDTGSVLTLGPNVVVDQGETSDYASLSSAGGNNTGDGIVNEGTINAQAVNGSFYIEPYNFTNQGTINVSNGDTLYIEPSVDLTNAGTITLAAGTTLTLGSGNTSALSNTGVISGTDDTVNIYSFGSFSNTGTFNITSSTVNLYGSYTTAQLALFDNKADTITIDGTLTNTGETLTVGAGSALGTVILASDGSIVGGTVVDQGSGVNFQGGTLSGVTYDGTLSSNSPYIYIATGLTADDLAGTGPGTINLTGTIYFEGNQTFNNATINLGGTIYNDDSNDTGSVLTLGPNVVVDQGETSGYAYLGSAGGNNTGDGIVNEGTINAQAVNGSFYIESYNFTNQGTINVSNGDTLHSGSTTFTNNGTIAISGSTVDIATAIFTNNGTISISGGTVDITPAIFGTGDFTINGGTLELGASNAETATFESGGGTLQLASPTSFSGEIAGITGSADILEYSQATTLQR